MHQHAGGRGVDAALRLGDRHALHAVHAALVLQPGPRRPRRARACPCAFTATVDVLVAAEVGLGGVEDLGPPAAPLGVAQVHPQQVAGEQRRLLAALAGLDLEDHVAVVVGVARDQQQRAARSASSSRCALQGGRPRRRTPRPRRPARGRRRGRRRSAARRGRRATIGVSSAYRWPSLRALRLVGVDRRVGQLRLELGVLGDECPRRPRTSRLPRSCSQAVNAGVPALGQRKRRCRRRTSPGGRGPALGSLASWRLGLLAVAGLEAGHAATGVEDLLLARVERVAGRADVGVDDAVRRRCCGW